MPPLMLLFAILAFVFVFALTFLIWPVRLSLYWGRQRPLRFWFPLICIGWPWVPFLYGMARGGVREKWLSFSGLGLFLGFIYASITGFHLLMDKTPKELEVALQNLDRPEFTQLTFEERTQLRVSASNLIRELRSHASYPFTETMVRLRLANSLNDLVQDGRLDRNAFLDWNSQYVLREADPRLKQERSLRRPALAD